MSGGVGEGEKEGRGGVESGDQDVERKFSVKVFSNERIIMQRSHSPPPPSSPPFSPSCLSFIVTHSLSVPPSFLSFSHLSLSSYSLSASLA